MTLRDIKVWDGSEWVIPAASGAISTAFPAAPNDVAVLTGDSTNASGASWRQRGPTIAIGDYWVTQPYITSFNIQTVMGRCTYEQMVVPHAMTISEVRINVNVAGNAGNLVRFGLYSPAAGADCKPGNLLADFGTVDISTNGTKAVTGLSLVLPAGILYTAHAPQGTGTVTGSIYCGYYPTGAHWVQSGSYAAGPVYNRSYYEAGVTGALPASAGTLVPTSLLGPLISFKRSA